MNRPDYLPLMSSQRWFLESGNASNPHHFNLVSLSDMQQELDPVVLELTMQQLQTSHDALRLRFVREETGWKQFIGEADQEVPITWINLCALSAIEQHTAIEAIAARLQTSLNIEEGPLLRMVYFSLDAGKPGKLLLLIHHLITDGFSNDILAKDFGAIYQQLGTGKQVSLKKTTSLTQWTKHLAQYIESEPFKQELEECWLSLPWDQSAPLPIDYPENRLINTIGSIDTLRVTLHPEKMAALLRLTSLGTGTHLQDVLLTILAQVITAWTKSPWFHICMWNFGRSWPLLTLNEDLSRTVGYIASGRQFLLDLREVSTSEGMLGSIKRQLDAIPNNLIGNRFLFPLDDDTALSRKLKNIPSCELEFNYLGRVGTAPSSNSFLNQHAHINLGLNRDPNEIRACLLKCSVFVSGQHLELTWEYSKNIHHRSTIEYIAQNYIQKLYETVQT